MHFFSPKSSDVYKKVIIAKLRFRFFFRRANIVSKFWKQKSENITCYREHFLGSRARFIAVMSANGDLAEDVGERRQVTETSRSE